MHTDLGVEVGACASVGGGGQVGGAYSVDLPWPNMIWATLLSICLFIVPTVCACADQGTELLVLKKENGLKSGRECKERGFLIKRFF